MAEKYLNNIGGKLISAAGGAFGTTGWRCTATSRLILHKLIKEQFLEPIA